MHCFGCFFQLLLLVAMIKDQFGRYLLVQVEETKQIESSQVIPKVKVEGEKKIDIPQVIPQVEVEGKKRIDTPQVIPQVEVEEEKKIDIPQVIPQTLDEEIKKIDTPQVVPQVEVEEEKKVDIPSPLTRGNYEFKDTNSSKHSHFPFNCLTSFNTIIDIYSSNLISFKKSIHLQDFKMVLLLVKIKCQLNG